MQRIKEEIKSEHELTCSFSGFSSGFFSIGQSKIRETEESVKY